MKKTGAEGAKLGAKLWTSLIIFGFFGQVAWIVENMYFNVFIDRTMPLSDNRFSSVAISVMVAASAITATAATLIGGIWSDRKGNRRRFISFGYIIWGIIIMSFSLITVDNFVALGIKSVSAATIAAIVTVVIMDCVMSYVGSTANDAAFNAWVTDNTAGPKRGVVEGVIAIMPILAMAAVFGGMDRMTQDTYLSPAGEEVTGWIAGGTKIATGNWTLFYILLGSIVTVVGIIGIFTIRDNPALRPNPSSDYRDIIYGFRKEVIKANKNLYLAYAAMGIVGIANNSFMSYLIMYAERTLEYPNGSYILPVAVIIVTSATASVVFGIFMAKMKDRRKLNLPLLGIYFVGAIGMLLASPICFEGQTPMAAVCAAGFVLMGANLCISANLTATVRDLTPPDKTGMFQGIRMVFWVLIPMVIGPAMTAIIQQFSEPSGSFDMNGNPIYNYTPYMFLIAAVIALFAVIPVILLNRAKPEEMNPFAAGGSDPVGSSDETSADDAVALSEPADENKNA